MMKLNTLNQLIVGTSISAIVVVISGCALTNPEDIKRVNSLISTRNCAAAENLINEKFLGRDYTTYWFGRVARDCRGNRQMAIQYFRESIRLGGTLATNELIRMGETPPEPLRPVIVQQAPAPQQQEPNTLIIIQEQKAPAPTKRFDPFGPLKF